jgi:small-conductance mechanosensitive channel
MDAIIAIITAGLQQWISSLGRGALEKPLLGQITGADLCVVALYLTLAILSNAAIALLLHRKRKDSVAEAKPSWQRRAYTAIGKPLYILVWVYGVYLAATPILLKLKPEQGLMLLRHAMDLLFDLGAVVALFWFLFRATHVLESHLAAWAATTSSKIDKLLVPLLGISLRIVVVVIAIIVGLPLLNLPPQYSNVVSKLTSIMLISGVTVLLFRAVNISQNVVLTRFDITAADNLRARKIYTQLHVISRVIYVTIGFFSVAAVLMLFQEVRHVGTSLLASAGIVGIIGGFAAQKTLANVFAGFQIALAQPVRQDDVVVVEGEWGRVEEITLTFVIVHIWDDRRMVLPLSYFIEKPFQNWTRTSAAITGSVLLWVDYSFPVEEGRRALKGIVENSSLWDGRFWNLQVSDASERTMQLRVLATSADSSKSWDLRCEIREKFTAFIQKNYPRSLPTLRTQLIDSPLEGAPGRAAREVLRMEP